MFLIKAEIVIMIVRNSWNEVLHSEGEFPRRLQVYFTSSAFLKALENLNTTYTKTIRKKGPIQTSLAPKSVPKQAEIDNLCVSSVISKARILRV